MGLDRTELDLGWVPSNASSSWVIGRRVESTRPTVEYDHSSSGAR